MMWWDEAIRLKMITTWWFKVGFWWFTRLENIKNKKLIYDPKFVYSHTPMSHHKIRFHLILLPKFLKFFFRTNWFRFNRNYRAFHSAVTFSWTFWGPPKNGVLLYNFFPFRIFLENFFKSIIIAQTPLSSSWLVSAMKPFSKLWGKGKNSETFGLWWQVSTRVDVVVQIFFSSPGVDHRALVYLPPSRGH